MTAEPGRQEQPPAVNPAPAEQEHNPLIHPPTAQEIAVGNVASTPSNNAENSSLARETDPEALHYQQIFEREKRQLESRVTLTRERLELIRERTQQQIANYKRQFGGIDPKREKWFLSQVAVQELSLHDLEAKLAMLRPSSRADENDRQTVFDTLSTRISETSPAELPLRFRGMPLNRVLDCIDAGGIFPVSERIGTQISSYGDGEIGVTDSQNAQSAITYADLTDNHMCIPAGCIFVLFPQDAQDAATGTGMSMRPVDFHTHPKQLFRILTSNENLPVVKQKLTENGIDPNIVTEFLDFPEEMERLKEQIKITQGQIDPKTLIPYEQ